jgi:hypothetical protein
MYIGLHMKYPLFLSDGEGLGRTMWAREVVESGAGTRSGHLSGFDIRVLIEILWLQSPHMSSIIATVQDSSENTENDQGDNDVKLFIEFDVPVKRFQIKLHF